MIPFNHDSNNVALNKKRRLFFYGCVSHSMTRLAILACEENRKLILHIKKKHVTIKLINGGSVIKKLRRLKKYGKKKDDY